MSAEFVTWDQIEAECDGFRAGFVKVYRKYQGEMALERSGHPVKVTIQNFARHLGVDRSTFDRWIRNVESGASLSGARLAGEATNRTGQMARQAVKSDKVSVDDKVGMLSDLFSDPKVRRAYIEQRAPKVSEKDAKAAAAWAKSVTDKIAGPASKLQVPMWTDQLKSIAQNLAEYEFDVDEVRALRRVERKLDEELTVQEFRLGLKDAEVPQ